MIGGQLAESSLGCVKLPAGLQGLSKWFGKGLGSERACQGHRGAPTGGPCESKTAQDMLLHLNPLSTGDHRYTQVG